MKTYRQPFYKTNMMVLVGSCTITFAITFPVMAKHFYMALNNGVALDYLIKISIFGFIPLVLMLSFIVIYNCFYIVVSNDRIEIINGILPFLKKSYLYNEISGVEIGNKGGLSQNYIKVKKSNKTKSIPLVICLVSKEDCQSLFNDLKSSGVDVEISGNVI